MARQMTPLLRPLRSKSGTMYVFPSATEDIGLNLNTRGNRVALSKYVLLNLPATDTNATGIKNGETSKENFFNFTNIPGLANMLNNNTSADTPEAKIAVALQNYLMNFEVTLVNQQEYDYSASKTVSERCFWKFLKETGAIRWKRTTDESGNYVYSGNSNIYEEEDERDANGTLNGYNKVVVGLGQISAGNSLSNEFNMYNETYVSIPSTYGMPKVYFKVNEDNNYRLGEVYINEQEELLAGRTQATSTDGFTTIMIPAYDVTAEPDVYNITNDIYAKDIDSDLPWYQRFDQTNAKKSYAYFTESEPEDPDNLNYTIGLFQAVGGNGEDRYTKALRRFLRSRLDGVEVVSDIDEVASIWDAKKTDHGYVSFDTINTNDEFIEKADFNFNAILVYYTIYDKNNGSELATNLFGILFLNGPTVDALSNTGDAMKFAIEPLNKRKSNGAGSDRTFGSGYSFKINIKSTSIYDNTDAVINDETTSTSLYTDDFNNVVYNLNKSVDLLSKNSQITQSIHKDYRNLVAKYNDLMYSIQSLNTKINNLVNSRFSDIDASNIRVQDLQVDNNLEVHGSLYIDPSVDMNIENFSAADIDSSTLKTEVIDTSAITTHTMNVDEIKIKYLDVSSFLSENASMYSINVYDDIFQEVNVGAYNVINDKQVKDIHNIIQGTKVSSSLINKVDYQYVIHPISFNPTVDGYAMSPVEYLYNGDEAQVSKVNYLKFIPLIIAEIQKINREIVVLNTKTSAIQQMSEDIDAIKSQLGLDA